MSTKHVFVVAAMASIYAPWSGATDKPTEWQTAKVLDISVERIGEGGIYPGGGRAIGPGSGNLLRDKGVTYTIQVGEITYVASEFSMARHRLKPERVKEGEVQISLKSERILVLKGEDGRSYDLKIVNRSH